MTSVDCDKLCIYNTWSNHSKEIYSKIIYINQNGILKWAKDFEYIFLPKDTWMDKASIYKNSQNY